MLSFASQGAPGRLAAIRSHDRLHCGIWPEVPGFATERSGSYAGFDIDTCRAVAVAILGDASKVSFDRLQTVEEFTRHSDIDLAVRRLTWTPAREQSSGLVFGPVTFFDGQGFLVSRKSNIRTISQLAGKSVCVTDSEGYLGVLHDYLREARLQAEILIVKDDSEAERALRMDKCQAYTSDVSWLAAARSRFHDGPFGYSILHQQISKEPLAPLMRAEDEDFIRVVRWTIYVLIEAEEFGVNSRNVDAAQSRSTRIATFLSLRPSAQGSEITARNMIAVLGNYGELYSRNLGVGSNVRLQRGLNRLWSDGGLIYAPPLDR